MKPPAPFVSVRWPRAKRQELKVAAAQHDPPLTMGEYLVKCFLTVEAAGGLDKFLPHIPRRNG